MKNLQGVARLPFKTNNFYRQINAIGAFTVKPIGANYEIEISLHPNKVLELDAGFSNTAFFLHLKRQGISG